jgi:hypothetical protein
LRPYDKTLAINNLRGEVFILAPAFVSFSSEFLAINSGPGPVVRQSIMAAGTTHLMEDRKQRERERERERERKRNEGTSYILQRHTPRDLLSLARSHLLKFL